MAARGRSFSSKPDDLSLNDEGAESPDHGNGNGTPKAPDATARYQKARFVNLSIKLFRMIVKLIHKKNYFGH